MIAFAILCERCDAATFYFSVLKKGQEEKLFETAILVVKMKIVRANKTLT